MAQNGPPGGPGLPFGDRDVRYNIPASFNNEEFNQDFILGQPVLNQEDQDLLNHFWDNPNESSGNDGFFSNLFSDPKTDSSSAVPNFSGFSNLPHSVQSNQSSVPSDMASQFMNHSNHNRNPGHVGGARDRQSEHQMHGDIDVTAAASSLFGMAGQRLAAGGGSTWGTLPVNFPIPASHGSRQHRPSSSQSSNLSQTSPTFSPHHTIASDTWQMYQRQQAGMPANRGTRPHSLQLDRSAVGNMFGQQPPPRQWPSSQSIQWGSDQSFSPHGFRGHVLTDKDRNLSMINHAIINHNSRAQNIMRSQQMHRNGITSSSPNLCHSYTPPASATSLSSPFGYPGLQRSFSQNPNAGRCGGMDSMPGQNVNPSQRKRRRSQSGFEDEADYRLPSSQSMRHSQSSGGRRGVKAERRDSEERALELSRMHKRFKMTRGERYSRPSTPDSTSSDPRSQSPAQRHGSSKKHGSESATRPNLTEDQKRGNHIKSEQRRRDLIKAQFDDIGTLVPVIKNSKTGFSRSDGLFEAVKYIKRLAAGNAIIQEKFGIRLEKEEVAENQKGGGGDVLNDDGIAAQ